jgi:hypothetical protein
VVQNEHQCLCTNIEVIDRLMVLADRLRRTNAGKWDLSFAEWQAAVNEVLSAPEPRLDDEVAHATKAVRNAVRRLANSGEARFGSASVGRDPNSSLAGNRFYDDLEAVNRRLDVLRRTRDCT